MELARRIERYRNKTGDDRYTDAMKQHKQLNIAKQGELNWMYTVSKCVPQEALRDLDRAFKNFFRDRKKWGFPRFKKKGKTRDSFRLTGTIKLRDRSCKKTGKNHTCVDACRINSSMGIQLPRLGVIRLKEVPDLADCHIQSATVSRTADRWYVSLSVRKPDDQIELPDDPTVLGVDLGLKDLAITSDGDVYDNHRHLRSRQRKIRKLQKSLARKQYRSNNWYKAKRKLAVAHKKIADARSDVLHKMTTEMAENYDIVVIEDLSVSNLMKNRKMSRSIADVAWSEIRRMLEYKANQLVIVPRFFPSSKLCSECWYRKEDLKLSDRVFICDRCGMQKDRDLNAARNLELYGLMFLISPTVADSWSETINACGEGVRPLDAFQLLIEGADDGGDLCEAGSQHV